MKIGGIAILSYYYTLCGVSPIHGFTIPYSSSTNHYHHHSNVHNTYYHHHHQSLVSTPQVSNNFQLLQMSISPLEESTTSSSSSSSSSRVGRSNEEIERELSSGRILEDGPVIDFGSVKDSSSKAEIALAQARKEYIDNLNNNNHNNNNSNNYNQNNHNNQSQQPQIDNSNSSNSNNQTQQRRLMGINDEVVQEVGREVGAFVNDDILIQKCAAYLRSKAPKGMFEDHEQTAINAVPMYNGEESMLDSLLRESYMESGLVTEAFAKTFYLGTQLLPQDAREAIWAVYVWCRRTDEIVDAPRQPGDVSMLTDLSSWEIRLENLFRYGIVEDVLDLPLLDCKIKYPKLPIEPFVDMIRGMLMDIPDLGQDRYDTFEELHLYCYRVAGTVGLMSMPVFGCAPGYTEEEAKEPALSLGVAFQLTNILRDVGEDAVKRGRIYLPREDMERFGVTEEQIFARRMDENYVAMMKFQIERARMYYDRALRGVPMLRDYSRLPVQSSLDCYGKILDKIEANGYDSLNYRAYVSKQEKMLEVLFSWYRTQAISKILPLPAVIMASLASSLIIFNAFAESTK